MRGGGIGRGKHRCEELRCGAVQFIILSPKKGRAPGIASWGSVTNGTGMQVFFPGASLEQPVTYISYNRYSGECDCVLWSLGGSTFHDFTVFWNQFILPHCTVAVSLLSVLFVVQKILLVFLKCMA